MTWHRSPPPSPQPDPPSVLLMRALGDLQAMEGSEPITDMEAIASLCGIVWVDLPALIEVGIVAGYLEEDEEDPSGAIGPSAKGQRWYERGRPPGSILRRE